MDLQARTFSMPRYAGQRPPPAYRLTVSTRKGKIFVFGGVGGNGQMSLLDTGHAPAEMAATNERTKKVPSALDAAAAALFAADEVRCLMANLPAEPNHTTPLDGHRGFFRFLGFTADVWALPSSVTLLHSRWADPSSHSQGVGGLSEGGRGLDATRAAQLVALLQDLGLNKHATTALEPLRAAISRTASPSAGSP